jgi:hypothetical protein
LYAKFLYIHLQIGKIPTPPPFIPLVELRKERIRNRAKTRNDSKPWPYLIKETSTRVKVS